MSVHTGTQAEVIFAADRRYSAVPAIPALCSVDWRDRPRHVSPENVGRTTKTGQPKKSVDCKKPLMALDRYTEHCHRVVLQEELPRRATS